MSGFWDLNSEADYYNYETNYGSYQYQTLNDLINTFLAYYVGENKIIPKAAKEDVAFFARRAAQELSYDTLRSKKTWEVEVNNGMCIPLPHDFVGYTDVFWSSPNGIKRPLYPTRHTQNPFNPTPTDEPFVETITTETITEEQIITNEIPSNTKVYVFYDGTSMGAQQTADAYSFVTQWLDGLAGFTRDEDKTSSGHNVYHVAVAGERWLDWASVPMTGQFNNRQVKAQMDGAVQQSHYVSAVNDTFYKYPMVTSGHIDHHNGATFQLTSLASTASYWSFLNAGDANGTGGVNYQFYDVAQADGSGLGVEKGDTVDLTYNFPGNALDGTSQTITMQGAPPQASPGDDILVIVFADEAHPMYHGEGTSESFTSHSGSNANAHVPLHVGYNTPVVQPTSVYKNDYDEYVKNYDQHTGNYNVFVYPKEKSTTSGFEFGKVRRQYIPHLLAAISSGNQVVPDGTWQNGTAPTFDALATGQADGNPAVAGLEATPPIGGYDQANPNPNPYWQGMNPQFGGLDQYGVGTNISGGQFTSTGFEDDLNDFISGGVQEEIVTNTYEITNVETSGQNWYNINPDGSVAGDYNGTTLTNYQNSDAGEPIIADADYDHGYENITLGQRYGLSPETAQVNGSYYFDYENGKLFFSPALVGQTIVLDYISDGLDSSGNMIIHKFAEEAFYKHVAYAIASTGSNYSPATVQMLKKERFAATRNAKIRLSNMKTVEMEQIMRNKSKRIKH